MNPAAMTTAAHRLVDAVDALAELVAIPYKSRPSTDSAILEKNKAFRSFASLRGFRVGDRVTMFAHVPRTSHGTPSATVLSIGTKRASIELRGESYTFPLDATPAEVHLGGMFAEIVEEARSLIVADADEAPVVVVPCGGDKASTPAPAAELYVGSYFRSLLAAARTITSDDRILVLSGLHGFVALDTVLDPYEQRIDRDGAVTDSTLRRQVAELDPLLAVARGRAPVTILAGSAYTARAVEALGPEAEIVLPFAGSRGIGDHLGRAKRLVESAR